MKILGLTGGSGVGKGAASAHFIHLGCGSIDADAVYRRLCTDCRPMLDKLQFVFPNILFPDGSLNRKALGAIVFADPEKLMQLNGITHPYVRAETSRLLQEQWERGVPVCILDAPVLFESGFDDLCDATCGILASRDVRIARIIQRDGLTPEYAALRIDAQPTDDWYRDKCDYILTNDADLPALHRQVQAVYQQLLRKDG